MKKRIYSKEFKAEAVRLSYERDNKKALANELGVSPALLYRWCRELRESTESKSKIFPQDQLERVKRLERALKDKDLELEILKKAVHTFSNSGGKSTSL